MCIRDSYQPAVVSDHLSWSNGPDDNFPDLLPIPYTLAALDHFVREVGRVQDRLGRAILIENPSRYLAYASDDWDEVDFLHELCRRSGCALLLDINNVEVSAFNLGRDAASWLEAFDPRLVGEVHVAGHSRKDDDMDGTIAVDDHGSPVRGETETINRHVLFGETDLDASLLHFGDPDGALLAAAQAV